MFEIAAILALGLLSFLFAYIAFKVDKDRVHLQLIFFILCLLFAGSLVYVVSDFSLQAQEHQLINTTENSLYWNCTSLNYTCTGEPAEDSCTAYNYDQCIDIDNCTWVTQPDEYCMGTPNVTCNWLGAYDTTGYKCEETIGCSWDGLIIHALCDRVTVTYEYENATDYSYQNEWYLTHFGVIEVLIVFVLLYLFLLVFISVFNGLWIKGRDREGLDDSL